MPSRIDYRFRAVVSADSQEAILVKYLRDKNSEFSEKDMILWATAAYWLPLALKQQGSYSASLLKQSARTSIYKLRQHINYLAQTFGLESEVSAMSMSSASPQANRIWSEPLSEQPIEEDQQMLPSTEVPLQPTIDAEVENLLHHQDDASFQEMFVN